MLEEQLGSFTCIFFPTMSLLHAKERAAPALGDKPHLVHLDRLLKTRWVQKSNAKALAA